MHVNRARHREQGGFSLIEVLIAILITAIGLLGFALTQTMSLRFTQASNQRTQATNLAYDLLDQMRANRLVAAQYASASFSPGSVAAAGCAAPSMVGTLTVATNITRWRCQVVNALGGQAGATVTVNSGIVNIVITWGEQRWNPTAADTSLDVRSRL